MNDELNNADKILDWMHKQAAEKIPVDPLMWLEAAIKLEILKVIELLNKPIYYSL